MNCVRFALVCAVLFLFLGGFSFAVQKTIVLGGENGWSQIEKMDGVSFGAGRFGNESIGLSPSVPPMTDDTDLMLSFDGKEVKDSAGNYEIVSNALLYSKDAVKGGGAAMSYGKEAGIVLKGGRNALFGRQGASGSFTIEFYLCPSLAESGETVFSWCSSLSYGAYSQYQMIYASFFNNKLSWVFNNIFSGYAENKVILNGYTNIIPGKWSRHTISYDEDTGALEYLVDGRTEDIRYITDNSHENGTVCSLVLGVPAGIELCSDYIGKIDNFRIVRNSVSENAGQIFTAGNETYRTSGGKFVTRPILVSRAAVMDAIQADMRVPAQTDVRLYVRSCDNCYGWTDSVPAWKEVVPGEKITGVSGMYFQLCAELLPDGNGTVSPSVSEISVTYTEQNEPLPPFVVNAEPGDGSVTVSWSCSVDDTADGYYVYYGSRPGEYLGRVAAEGASPIKAGNTTSLTLTGLQNGTIYYFAVSAYSKIDSKINGVLSKEVYARPGSRLGMK